jgi:hypothetical protein
MWNVRTCSLALLLAGLAMASACETDHQRDAVAGALSDPATADQLEPMLVGTYAGRSQVWTVQHVPILGRSENMTERFILVAIVRDQQEFLFTERACTVRSHQSGPVSVIVPDAIPRSVPPTTERLSISSDGTAYRWQRPTLTTVAGARLGNPATDALPTRANDPRVWDQDGDGHPGVTVVVSGIAAGEIYAVQRAHTGYEGVIGDGELSGRTDDRTEQSVVGASNPLLAQTIPLEPHPDQDRNTIVLRRLTGEYDCDRLAAEVEQLFPQ